MEWAIVSYNIGYNYGPGHIPCVPPKLLPWENAARNINENEFQAYNRGQMDVVYEWVERSYPDVSRERNYFHTVGKHNALLYQSPSAIGWTYITDNNFLSQTLRWGTPLSKVVHHGQWVDSTAYIYSSPTRIAANMFANLGNGNLTYNLWQISPVISTETTITRRDLFGFWNAHQITTERGYDAETRLLKWENVKTRKGYKKTDVQYAYEIADYGGTSWNPAALVGMRAQNLLTPIAQTSTFYTDLFAESTQIGCIDLTSSAATASANAGLPGGLPTVTTVFSVPFDQTVSYGYQLHVSYEAPCTLVIGSASIHLREDGLALQQDSCFSDGAGCSSSGGGTFVAYAGRTYQLEAHVTLPTGQCQKVNAGAGISVQYVRQQAAITLENSTVTTYAHFNNTWKPHRVYRLNTADSTCTVPAFDDWANAGGVIDPRWLLAFQADQYQFGELTQFRDGNGVPLEIFYGDNDNNLSNAAAYNGLSHAYITGIRLNNTLSKQFDYDPRLMTVNTLVDENSDSTHFYFDNFGRLISIADADHKTISAYQYKYSSELTGGGFSASSPNYIKTTLFYSAGQQTDSYEFYDGLARRLQSVRRADGYDYHSASDVDMMGREYRQYKTYRRTYLPGSVPQFDPAYVIGSGNLFTELQYNSLLDKHLSKTYFPGSRLLTNSNTFNYEFITANEVLPELYSEPDSVMWFHKSSTDENDNNVDEYRDEFGQKILTRQYSNNDQLTSTTKIVTNTIFTNTGWANRTDSVDFIVIAQQTVPIPYVLNVNILDPNTVNHTSRLTIKENGATLLTVERSAAGQSTGSFNATPGSVYSLILYTELQDGDVKVFASAIYQKYVAVPLNTHFNYDGSGNLWRVRPPNYFNPPAGSDSSDWIITYQYNTLGQLVAKHNPDADTTRYAYDPNSNLRFTQDANRKAAGEVLYTTYDFNNRPLVSGLTLADFDTLSGAASYAFENDTLTYVSVNQYDQAPNSSSFPWNHAPGMAAYPDSLENIVGRLAADAYRTAANEPINHLLLQNQTLTSGHTFLATDSITVGPGVTISGAGDIILKAGRRVRLTPGVTVQTGARLQAVVDPSLLTNPVTADLWQITLYSYDKNGRVKTKYIFSEGLGQVTLSYRYNRQGQITPMMARAAGQSHYMFYDYNGRGLLSKVYASTDSLKPALCEVAYSYNPAGLVDTLRYGESAPGVFTVELPHSYTIRDWLQAIGDVNDSGQPFGAQYSYFPNGNIQEAVYYNQAAALAGQKKFKYEYSYDAGYRLTGGDYFYESGGSWQTVNNFDVGSLSYDDNGNILSLQRRKETGSLIDDLTYSYGSNNRLLSVADGVSASTEDWDAEDTQFSYDPNGNVIRVVENGTAKFDTIAYDHRNGPTRIVTGDGTEIDYRYNLAGQRIFKKVDGNAPEYYILDGDQTVAVYQTGALKYWNLLANGVVGRVEPGSGSKFYYLKDHLGSTRAVVNSSGTVVEAHDYYPFGLLMPARDYQSGSETKEKFTGKERDAETHWDYFGARYYWAAGGRWLAVDPLADKYPSLSPYVYAANNPVVVYDPDGRYLETLIDLVSLGVSIYDVAQDPGSTSNWIGLGLDVVSVLAPGAAALGTVYKAGKKASQAVDVVKGTEKIREATGSSRKITEGVYEVTTTEGKTYVGQSKNIDRRLTEHVRKGKITKESAEQAKRTEVKGGKTQREIVEQKRITELGGVGSENVENVRNPIGKKREHLLEEKR